MGRYNSKEEDPMLNFPLTLYPSQKKALKMRLKPAEKLGDIRVKEYWQSCYYMKDYRKRDCFHA